MTQTERQDQTPPSHAPSIARGSRGWVRMRTASDWYDSLRKRVMAVLPGMLCLLGALLCRRLRLVGSSTPVPRKERRELDVESAAGDRCAVLGHVADLGAASFHQLGR